jgi:hypothetical protein
MGPCIVSIFQYISNKMQRYTVYFIWKLLYMFQMVQFVLNLTFMGPCIVKIF